MAWTTPLTAVENTVWTSAQWNTHVRDNMAELAPAKATTAGQYFVATSTNNSIAARAASTANVATSQTRTSTSYGDLATVGPAVTVTTGTRALVFTQTHMFNSADTNSCYMSHAVSGATTVAASDEWCARMNENVTMSVCSVRLHTSLTAGSNTFTAKYRVAAGTGTFHDRWITVFPF